MVKVIRYLLFPLSVLYGLIVAIRNFLFDNDIMKSSEFDVPTIVVGNLTAGGTGKTPHVEYLIRLLKGNHKVATLSRGYGRKTTGFIKADIETTAKDIGDEPMQFHSKFSDITVNVGAKRVAGIIEIMGEENSPEVILLDDAFQHRQLKSGFSILLTDYNRLFYKDFMLPTGYLREFGNGRKRANTIIVTKCPASISEEEKLQIIQKIKPNNSQSIFFSTIKYGNIKSIWDESILENAKTSEVVLVTGIAKSEPFKKHVESKFKINKHFDFPDHHNFTDKNIQSIITTFEKSQPENCVILTTEKDAMRLKLNEELKKYPIYYTEIEIEIIGEGNKFDKEIIEGYEPPHIDESQIKKPKGNPGQNRNRNSRNPNSKPGNKKHYYSKNSKGKGGKR